MNYWSGFYFLSACPQNFIPHSSADRKSSSKGHTTSGVRRYFCRISPTSIVLRWSHAELAWISAMLGCFISLGCHGRSSMATLLLVSTSRCCLSLADWSLHQITLTLLLLCKLLNAWWFPVSMLSRSGRMRSMLGCEVHAGSRQIYFKLAKTPITCCSGVKWRLRIRLVSLELTGT